MAAQHQKEKVGKELPTKAMRSIIKKTLNKPRQQLQQWQMHMRENVLSFQDRFVKFKESPEGQGMGDLVATQKVATVEILEKGDAYKHQLDCKQELEYHERYVKYEHELAAVNCAKPTKRKWFLYVSCFSCSHIAI
jgi:hypothetical protein